MHLRYGRVEVLAAGLATALLLAGCERPAQPAAAPAPAPAPEDPVQRGKYLAVIGGCHDCHTPKLFSDKGMEFDMSRALSGHPAGEKLAPLPKDVIGPDRWGVLGNAGLSAWYGPWGVSFAINLTPHATGIAAWSEQDFIGAMRTGKHAGVGRPILPPMPWFNWVEAPEDELRALYAYFRSLPPIDNKVPEPIPPATPPA